MSDSTPDEKEPAAALGGRQGSWPQRRQWRMSLERVWKRISQLQAKESPHALTCALRSSLVWKAAALQ